MLHARAGSGKTRLALSLAYAYATGTPLMDWSVPEPGTALFVDAELPPGLMQAWLNRLGRRASRRLYVLSDKLNYLDGQPRVSLLTEADREYVAAAIAKCKAKLVVLDALFTLAPPRMNADGRVAEDLWSTIARWIGDLKRQGLHVVLLHHDRREGGQFGSSLKEIEFDLLMQLVLRRDYSGDGRWAFELTFPKPRHLSADDAKPRIITVTDDGPIEWARTDLPIDKPKERDPEAQGIRDQIMDLTAKGLTVPQIAEKVGRKARWVQQVRREERQVGDNGDGLF
jgi:AAA domain